MKKFYVYRYIGLNCKDAQFLGEFETPLELKNVWDLMFQAFCSDGGGMFVRRTRIW